MKQISSHRQTIARIISCAIACALIAPVHTEAQSSEAAHVTFELRPHCDSVAYRAAFTDATSPASSTAIDDTACPTFNVRDPETLQTDVIKSGDTLDMDLVVKNPSAQSIERFRAWIAYDPTTLNGDKMVIAKNFPTPNPGETDFSPAEGIVKISGTADAQQTAAVMVVAHITLHVLPGSQQASPIVFYDATGTTTSHTGVFTKNDTQETNLVTTTLGSLLVRLMGTTSSAHSAASSSARSSAPRMTPPPPGQTSSTTSVSSVSSESSGSFNTTVFTLLQVQNLRATTEGGSVFLAWNILPSTELIGYNIYYGTVTGKYIQKRSVDKTVNNMTIRGLSQGVPYYFAIRGINARGEETDFSQEVGITVGNAATSTSPLIGSVLGQSPSTPRSGGKLSGETGTPSTLLLFLALSAVIGTFVAFRRQLTAKPTL